MKKISLSMLVIATALSSNAYAEEATGMKEQAKDDWQEIRNTAGEAAATTAEWGRSVGSKAAELGKEAAKTAKVLGKKAQVKATELTEKARVAAQKEENEKQPSGNRFFY
ncbi:MAG: hypothetical protein ACSHXK_09305 [Oceanococcus sp.]